MRDGPIPLSACRLERSAISGSGPELALEAGRAARIRAARRLAVGRRATSPASAQLATSAQMESSGTRHPSDIEER